MPKLCLVIPMWQRHTLTNHVLTYYHALEVPGVETVVVAVGSEGVVSKRLARGLEYVEASNRPIDAKYDAGFQHCQSLNPDAVCLIGSDDVFTEPYFSWALTQLAGGTDLVGLLDLHLVDLAHRQVWYWGGYQGERAGEPIASGRMYSRGLLDALGWSPYRDAAGYYDRHQDDERSLAHVIAVGGRVQTARMANLGCMFWAIKTGSEWNPMSAFRRVGNLTEITPHAWKLFDRTLRIDPTEHDGESLVGTSGELLDCLPTPHAHPGVPA